jgi:signal transduction histidine kinase
VTRLLPKSLIGQMALLIGLALLIAQAANFALVLGEHQKFSLAQNQGPAISRFAGTAADFVQAPAQFRNAVLEDASRRGAEFRVEPQALVQENAAREPGLEARLSDQLASAGVNVGEARAAFGAGPWAERARSGSQRGGRPLLLCARLPGGAWLNARLLTPAPDPWLAFRLAAATFILYLVVLGATLFLAARIVRPLRDLAGAAESFGGRESPPEVEPRGPADLRRAIEAFNAMNARVALLLDEKDRMLGAIGHDLRTPLASLRLRAEEVEDGANRDRIIAITQEMNAMLEDILVLARSGRLREPPRLMDVAALAETVAQELAELGAAVTFEAAGRIVAPVRPNLLRRALRNLVDNAVKYGGSVQVRVSGGGGAPVLIEVADRGPGLPPDQLAKAAEPFYRGEQSRSRTTGGAGLGLAIADAVAESHGGTLTLRNRGGGGLVAAISLFSAPGHSADDRLGPGEE